MDQPPAKRHFRFGLRTLLLLVAVCGAALGAYVYSQQPPYEVRQATIGMTEEEAHAAFGKPRMNYPADLQLIYEYPHGYLILTIPEDTGRCSRILFRYGKELNAYEKLENGKVIPYKMPY